MPAFDAPFTTDRPGFDYLTMQQEWVDVLGNDGLSSKIQAHGHTYDMVEPALVAEVTRNHSLLFAQELSKIGVNWNDVTGVLSMTTELALAVKWGKKDRPTREDIDNLWSDTFEVVADSLFDIQTELNNRS